MTLQQSELFISLAEGEGVTLDAEKKLPTAFRIFKAGVNETEKGSFLFDEEAAKSVMAAAEKWGNDYPIDYAHGMLKPAIDPALANRRAARFRPEIRRDANGGLECWATKLRWTRTAASMLGDDEYGYTSPAFNHEPKGDRRIVSLVNVALTNLPATRGMEPLVADKLPGNETGEENESMKTVAVALALAADAPESEVLSQVTALRSERTELMKLTKTESPRAAFGVVATILALAPALAVLTKVTGKETEEEALAFASEELPKLAKLEKERAKEKIEKKIDEKIAGFFVAPGEKEALLEVGLANEAALDRLLGTRNAPIFKNMPQAAQSGSAGTTVTYLGRTINVPPANMLATLGFKDADEYVATEKKAIDEEGGAR